MAITWSPTQILSGAAMSGLSNGNLTALNGAVTFLATVGKSSGKWYFEIVIDSGTAGSSTHLGLATLQHPQSGTLVAGFANIDWRGDKAIISGGSVLATSESVPSGTIGIAFDVDLRRVWFASNNVWILSGDPANNLNPTTNDKPRDGLIFFPACSPNISMTAHFAAADFTYTPPTGFSALTEPSDWTGLVGRALPTSSLLRRDMEDGGALSIIEPVTRLNAIPPQSRRVRLCDQRSGRLVREQWSDPTTGEVDFQYLREGQWVLYALDHTYEHEAVIISDRLATVDGLRP